MNSRAEARGFEPLIPFGMPSFQDGALGRYATPPLSSALIRVRSERIFVVVVFADAENPFRTDSPDYCALKTLSVQEVAEIL